MKNLFVSAFISGVAVFMVAQKLMAGIPGTVPHYFTGSAGIFGDPHIGLYTPQILKTMDDKTRSRWKFIPTIMEINKEYLLLQDPDSNLQIKARTVGVNPAAPASTVGLGTIIFHSHESTITLENSGRILVEGQEMARLNDIPGVIIRLKHAFFQCNNYSGDLSSLYCFFWDDEYKVRIYPRRPHPLAAGYFDLAFEENSSDSAANATGDTLTVPSDVIPQALGIPELLNMERY